MYIEGLKEQGIIGGKNNNSTSSDAGRPGKPAPPPVDYADGIPLPRGFQTRRAG